MRKTLLTALTGAALLTGSLSAADAPEFISNTIWKDGKRVISTSIPGCYRLDKPVLSRADDEEEELWVVANLEFDDEEYDVNPFPLVYKPGQEGTYSYGYYDYDTAVDFYLPLGEFDMLFEFKAKNIGTPNRYVYRHIDVTEDGMEFTVSAAEADQLIEFEPLDPDGKALSTDVIRLTDGEPDGIYSEGFLNIADQLFLVCSKQYGELMSYTTLRWSRFYDNGEYKTDCNNKVYASKSDDLYFCSGFGGVTDDASLACLLTSDGSRTQTVTNTTDYKTFEQNFIQSPYEPKADDSGKIFPKGHSCVNSYYICRNGVMGYRNRTVVGGQRYNQTKIIAWQAPAERRCGMTLLPVPATYEGLEQTGYIEGLPLYLDGEEDTYMAGIMNSGRFRINSQGNNEITVFANPRRSIAASENPVWGNGFPTIRAYRGTGNSLLWGVAGPLGETRLIDGAILDMTLNGEKFTGESVDLAENSEIKLQLKDTNYELCEIRGTATLETGLTVKDETSVPPTIQSFRVVNAEGVVATELENTADGVAEIYGGMFTLAKTDDGVSYYECAAPAEIVVEYAPNATDEWEALEVKADEAYDFLPGWGCYYSASLKGITRNSANKLYDLRLTMKGSNGEYAIQTVSPAFSSSEELSIETIDNGSSIFETIYYDLSGRRVMNPVNGGIYIRTDIMTDGSRRVSKTVR